MPRFDGTGPFGRGAGTGWGMGPCGGGMGFRRGGGRGFRRFWDYSPYQPRITKTEEKGMLSEEAEALKEELEEIKKRLAELKDKE